MILTFVFVFFLCITLLLSVVIVQQQTARVIQRMGKFHRVAAAGLSLKIPFIDWSAGTLSLQIQQLNIKVETKTKDNVFVNVVISVQYYVIESKVFEAFYKLQDPSKQITTYVFDNVRSFIPTLALDDVFAKQDDIANSVSDALKSTMEDFGYGIVKSLVTDISPDEKVKASMNEINAAQRLQTAAQAKGEANKIIVVKAAEAEAESKKLQGEGIANQRKAIINGLKESVDAFKEATGVDSGEVMNLVLLTQYFDTMKEIGTNGANNTVFMPSSPSGMKGFADEIRTAIIGAGKVQ